MASLKGRLSRLRELGLVKASSLGAPESKAEAAAGEAEAASAEDASDASGRIGNGESAGLAGSGAGFRHAFLEGWEATAPSLWTRVIEMPLAAKAGVRPGAWATRSGARGEPPPGGSASGGDIAPIRDMAEFSFFDFETTGLSGGAGTIPFLAAVGAFESGVLTVTQAFIDDYPGEPAFLEFLLAQLASRPAVVTYNGTSFDMPLLRTRCIVNGIPVPRYEHVDALYPARRLWKRKVGSCALKTLETEVLELDRGEDIPGSMIPRAWLDFAAGRGEGPMGLVCSHNASDISSLARLFMRIDRVYENPSDDEACFRVDRVRLARHFARSGRIMEGLEMLESLAADGDPEAGMTLCRLYGRLGRRPDRARVALALPEGLRECVEKAKACEHCLGDHAAALAWTCVAIGLAEADGDAAAFAGSRAEGSGIADLELRRARLERKMARGSARRGGLINPFSRP